MNNPHLFDEEVGLLRTGAVVDYNPTTGKVKVQLHNATSISGKQAPITVYAPYALTLNNGMFIGAKPAVGSPIVVGQGSSNEYYFVSFLAENVAQVPIVKDNELYVYANDRTKITLNKSTNDIYVGSVSNKIHVNSVTNLLTTNFYDEQHFTQASRQINGLIKRDRTVSDKFDLNSRLENDNYDSRYTIISLDPTLSPNASLAGGNKNPPFVEDREIIYEFQDVAGVRDEIYESSLYGTAKPSKTIFLYPNRRKSKADTLSLTLSSPNYLMETVKGTVVDIFGNLLDLNRVPLPIGKDQNTLNDDTIANKTAAYLKIREIQRKGIAYHFEINARKDFGLQTSLATNFSDLFGYNAKFPNSDYGRIRSRMFLDIDKEGQLKINVPASSEKGNIPLLTRYENYSTLSSEDNNNPDKLIYRDDLLDILQDSFAAPKLDLTTLTYADAPGSITILNGDASGTPQDRRYDNTHIKHGTAYHDILATCYAHQMNDFLQYQYDDDPNKSIDISSIPLLTNVVSDTIQISGPTANAGGRSGVFNFDGMLEFNLGANTIDRQSLWLDTAGAIVANLGRDKKNMSAALSMNGDVFIQVGGLGVVGDSRFVKQQNGQMGAVLDLRVFTEGNTVTMLRIDKNGVTIMTPGNFNVYAAGTTKFTGGTFEVDVENCIIQQRFVNKIFEGSI